MSKYMLAIRFTVRELLLLIGLIMAGFSIVGILDYIIGFGSTATDPIKTVRNGSIASIALIMYILMKKKWTQTEKTAFYKKNYQNANWGRIIGIATYLLLFIGVLQLIVSILNWGVEDINNEDLIIQTIIFAFPPLTTGSIWMKKHHNLQKYLGKKQSKIQTQIISESQITSQIAEPFEIARPTILLKVVIIVLTLLIIYLYISFAGIYFIAMATISVVASLFVWVKITPIIYLRIFRVTLDHSRHNILITIVAQLLGINRSHNARYYLAAQPKSVSAYEFLKLLKDRVFGFVFSSMAITFVLVKPLLYELTRASASDDFERLVRLVEIMIFSPIVTGLLILPISIAKDAGIRYIDSQQISGSLDFHLQRGLLKNLLGIGGFIAGIDFILQLYEDFPNLSAMNGQWPNQFIRYIDAGVLLLFISIFLIPIIYIIMVVYLYSYHSQIINMYREQLAVNYPVCSTVVKQLNTYEKQLFVSTNS